MYCPKCGNYMDPNSPTCTVCGANNLENNGGSVNIPSTEITTVKNNKKKPVGIICVGFLVLLFFIVYVSVFKSSTEASNVLVGTWDCKKFNSYSMENIENDPYVLEFKFNNSEQFSWAIYDDFDNTHALGTYEFHQLDKTNPSGDATYYSVRLNASELVYDGVAQSQSSTLKYEMGMTPNNDEAIVVNETSYNMYYCYKVDKKNPKINVSSTSSNNTAVEDKKKLTGKVDMLTYNLPEGFDEDAYKDDNKIYFYYQSDVACRFDIKKWNNGDLLSESEYFDKYVRYKDDTNLLSVTDKEIGGLTWKVFEYEEFGSKYEVSIYLKDNDLYYMQFRNLEKNVCSKFYDEIKDSIEVIN